MRAGKFMRGLILETGIGKLLSPCVVNWIAGDVFTQQWCTYTHGKSPDMELHVNNDLGKSMTVTIVKGVSVHAWWMRTGLRSIMIR